MDWRHSNLRFIYTPGTIRGRESLLLALSKDLVFSTQIYQTLDDTNLGFEH